MIAKKRLQLYQFLTPSFFPPSPNVPGYRVEPGGCLYPVTDWVVGGGLVGVQEVPSAGGLLNWINCLPSRKEIQCIGANGLFLTIIGQLKGHAAAY